MQIRHEFSIARGIPSLRRVTLIVVAFVCLLLSNSACLLIFSMDAGPSVSVNLGATVLEGHKVTLRNSELNSTDNISAPTGIFYTLLSITHGVLRKSGTVLEVNETFSQDDIDQGRMVFYHTSIDTSNGTFTFSVTDSDNLESASASATNPATFTITPRSYSVFSTFLPDTIGINYDYSHTVSIPRLEVISNVLYAIWLEDNGAGIRQVRARKASGPVSSLSWSSIDGGGLNYDLTKDANGNNGSFVFNGELYVSWGEFDASVKAQLRVKKYSPATGTWQFVDGGGVTGLNYSTSRTVLGHSFAVNNGKLYIVWREQSATQPQIRARVYVSGSTWDWVDGGAATGINYDSVYAASAPRLMGTSQGLVACWDEVNPLVVTQIRCKYYNGNDAAPSWTSFAGETANAGLNIDSTRAAVNPVLGIHGNQLYVLWREDNGSAVNINRAKVLGGTFASPIWTNISGTAGLGLNLESGQASTEAALFSFGDGTPRLYAFLPQNYSGNSKYHLHLQRYNLDSAVPAWPAITNLGEGVNRDLNETANRASVVQYVDSDGTPVILYGFGEEDSGLIKQFLIGVLR